MHARPVYNVMGANQCVLLPPGLCAGLYVRPVISLHSLIVWCEISIPVANTGEKVFPSVLVKDTAEQSSA